MGSGSDDYGIGFSNRDFAHVLSNDGDEFGWRIAAYTPIGGERVNLEQNQDRILTDEELQNADVIVVQFDDGRYKTFTNGPWDDWEDLYDEIADWYDVVSP